MASLEKIGKIYKTHAKFYDLTRKFSLFNRKKAVELLDVQKQDKILDLACGTGLNISLLLKKTSSENILGIDYSEAMLRKAGEKYPNIKFIQGDVSAYKFSKKVDKIICTYAISMIDNYEKTIFNVKNSLKDNGVFVILDFYKWNGVIKPFYPIFKSWIKKYGVNPEKNLEFCLKENFKKVEIHVLNSGYNFIAVAREPKV